MNELSDCIEYHQNTPEIPLDIKWLLKDFLSKIQEIKGIGDFNQAKIKMAEIEFFGGLAKQLINNSRKDVCLLLKIFFSDLNKELILIVGTMSPNGKSKEAKVLIFISHSNQDCSLATKVVKLIKDTIKIGTHEIRCTSVPGYQISPSSSISSTLRKELEGCQIVIGIITTNSLNSSYVLFELGVAWFLDKAWVLLAPNMDLGALPGPLKEHYALFLNNKQNLLQLVDSISDKTGKEKENGNIVNNAVDTFIGSI